MRLPVSAWFGRFGKLHITVENASRVKGKRVRNAFDRTPASQLFELIWIALMIQIEWDWVIVDQKWSRHGVFSEATRTGALVVILIGVLATAAYVRWAVLFSATTEEARKEKPYRRTRDLAWTGWLIFGVIHLLA